MAVIIDIDYFEAKLKQRHTVLLELSTQAKSSEKPVELDQTSVGRLSRMDAMQQQSMALAEKSRREAELKRIEQALRLIEDDEYGYCVSCGEEMDPRRLELDPSIMVCLNCAI